MQDETITEFVLRLKRNQVSVAVKNGELAVSCPAGRMPEQLLAELKDRKIEILQFLGRSRANPYLEIETVGEQPDYETSPSQRRIWMCDQLDPSKRAYNVPGAYLLTGELNLAPLQESLNTLVTRHEILRTTFFHRDGEIRQRVHEELAYTIRATDMTSEGQRQHKLYEIIRQSLEMRFDLTTLPLFHIHLVRIEENSTLVLFNLHHIICDGRSLALLTNKLFSSYRHHAAKTAPAPRIHYRDYSTWINRLLESGALDYQREYWQLKLGGEAPFLQLPYDYLRPDRLSHRSLVKTFTLSPGEANRFRELAAASRCSLFNSLLAFVYVLLYRLTGNDDIRIGTPVIGRPHAELQDQIGCHINLLVLRNRIQGPITLECLMQTVQSTTADAFAHQLYPFEWLASELAVRREPNRNPLFDVLVTLQEDHHELDDVEDFQLTPYPIRANIGRYDLTFGFEEAERGICLNIEYLTELFTGDTVEKFGSQFLELVRSGLENPGASVADLAGICTARRIEFLPRSEPSIVSAREKARGNAPFNEVQGLLLGTLRDILRNPALDIHDNYFEHGGDSIKAMQTITRLSRRGLVLDISDFFVYPIILELSSQMQPVGRMAIPEHGVRPGPVACGAALPGALDNDELEHLLAKYPSWRGNIQNVTFLSPIQEGMMFHSIAQPDSSMYHAQMTFTLSGRISPETFARAWGRLFERHDVLRTRFVHAVEPRSLQVMLAHVDAGACFQYLDFRGLPTESQARLLRQAKTDDEQRGFALADDTLIRVILFQMSESQFRVLISNHQIILDGWSVGALFLEFDRIYNSLASSRPVELPAASSYATYVDWVERNTSDAQRQYWHTYLSDFRSPAALQFKKPGSGSSIAKIHFEIGPLLTSQLVRLGNEKTVTLSTILQALWGILLSKHNESDDVVFGLVVSVRPPEIEGIEHALGMYVNTVPVRLHSFGELTFDDLIVNIQTKALQSWPHYHFPLYEILKATPFRARLFDHLFIFQNYPMTGSDAASAEDRGFEAGEVEISECANYDLVVEARPGSTLRLTFEYNESAYERRDLELLAGHFLTLTQNVISDTGQRIKDLSLLDAETTRKLRDSIAEEQLLFSRIDSLDFE